MRSCIVQSEQWNIIFCRSTGRYDQREMRKLMTSVMSLDLFQSGSPVFCDERYVEFSSENSDIGSIAAMPVDPPTQQRDRLVVMVATSDLAFETLRVLASRRERAGHRPMVFRTMKEAAAHIGLAIPTEAFPDDVENLMSPYLDDDRRSGDSNQLVLIKSRN